MPFFKNQGNIVNGRMYVIELNSTLNTVSDTEKKPKGLQKEETKKVVCIRELIYAYMYLYLDEGLR